MKILFKGIHGFHQRGVIDSILEDNDKKISDCILKMAALPCHCWKHQTLLHSLLQDKLQNSRKT